QGLAALARWVLGAVSDRAPPGSRRGSRTLSPPEGDPVRGANSPPGCLGRRRPLLGLRPPSGGRTPPPGGPKRPSVPYLLRTFPTHPEPGMQLALPFAVALLAPAVSAPPNLAFETGRLTNWQGQGFYLTPASGRGPGRAFAVCSSDCDTSGNTGLLHRTLVVP